MEKVTVHPEVQELYHEMVQIRRTIHQKPELFYDLPITSAFVAEYLTALGLEVTTGVGQSGVVGIKRGQGPTFLFRADMDALPLQEMVESEFKSQHPGIMHACGHDSHVAMLMTAAKVLSKRSLKGTIKFVFQPAEEGGLGAKAMVDDGVMEGVDEAYGIHVLPDVPLGDCLLNDDYMSANSDELLVEFRGRGGHGSAPERAIDPMPAVAQFITAVQTIVSRNVDPKYMAVVSICSVKAGETYNVIPDRVSIKATIRSYEPEIRDLVTRRFDEIRVGVAATFGLESSISYVQQLFSIVNKEPSVSRGLRAFQAVSTGTRRQYKPLFGEDFGYFVLENPGCFIGIGTGSPGHDAMLHDSKFNLDERAMLIGASWWVRLAENELS